MLTDSYGRKIDYLRLSVTDHCNLRPIYSFPLNGFHFSKEEELWTDAEIIRFISIAIGLGINKIRITGGEPLMRPRIVSLIEEISRLNGLEDLSLSTNGLLLHEYADRLYNAGLKRINISLDTLRPEHFQAVARFGNLNKVLEGVRAALKAGFNPIKINMVVIKGINSGEIRDFVNLTYKYPLHVRFMELIPFGDMGYFTQEHWMPLGKIMDACGELIPLDIKDCPRGYGPAIYFKSPGSLGTVGFISAMSTNFCDRCNRIRLTSKGRLVPCLASSMGVEAGVLLRSGANDEKIQQLIQEAVSIKPERHRMNLNSQSREVFMCAFGG